MAIRDDILASAVMLWEGESYDNGSTNVVDSSGNSFDGTRLPDAGTGPQWADSVTLSRPYLDFDGADYVRRTAAAVTGYPCTLFAWMYVPSAVASYADGCAVGVSRPGTPNNAIGLIFNNGASIRAVRVRTHSGNAVSYDMTGSGRDVWIAACATMPSTASNASALYVDGVSVANFTATALAQTPTETSAGALDRSSVGNYFRGRIATMLICDRALDSTEAAWLSDPANSLLDAGGVNFTRRRRSMYGAGLL